MRAAPIIAAARRTALTAASGIRGVARWFLEQRPGVQVGVVAAALVAVLWARSASRPEPVTDVEALARVIRSEAGTEPAHYRLHVAWATRNLAAERGTSIAAMACSPCGPQNSRRPVSTRFRPTAADRILAAHVLEMPARFDPTGGASHFINPRLQDTLARRGRPGYRGRPYAVVKRRWQRVYGWERYYRLGPTLEMWGKKRAGALSRR